MDLLDLTLPTAAENLALDEALLEVAEGAREPAEFLRMWESPQTAVIVGRSSRVAQEVNLPYCQDLGVPVLRRCSGGASVVIGPGCFMYSVVLSYELRPELRPVDEAHRFVLGKAIQALKRAGTSAQFQGTSDLTMGDRKISGNSMRCKHRTMLYHGTILRDFPLEQIQQCLRVPPREPEYRHGRTHEDFVTNVLLPSESLRTAWAAEWGAVDPLVDWPRHLMRELAADRYSNDAWTFRL